jgi:hypothetical protein
LDGWGMMGFDYVRVSAHGSNPPCIPHHEPRDEMAELNVVLVRCSLL